MKMNPPMKSIDDEATVPRLPKGGGGGGGGGGSEERRVGEECKKKKHRNEKNQWGGKGV